MELEKLQELVPQVRRDILRMVHNVSSGHPGAALGCTELLVFLFFSELELKDEFSMNGINEDLFFLSNGHLSAVLYSVLSRRGYFSIDELSTFRQINSRLQGHPTTHEGLPGIRISSGSLGQGLSNSIGACLAKKLNNDNRLVYCLTGDGELQEGQNWEAIMYAGAKGVDNLIGIVDYNKKQIDGSTSNVLDLGNLTEKFNAFGWDVVEVIEGNNLQSISEGMFLAKTKVLKGKPVFVILHTEMGNGVDFMMGTHAWHGKAPDDDQLKEALSQNLETKGDYNF